MVWRHIKVIQYYVCNTVMSIIVAQARWLRPLRRRRGVGVRLMTTFSSVVSARPSSGLSIDSTNTNDSTAAPRARAPELVRLPSYNYVRVSRFGDRLFVFIETLTCATCSETFECAWSLVKHVQAQHSLAIYVENQEKNSLVSATCTTICKLTPVYFSIIMHVRVPSFLRVNSISYRSNRSMSENCSCKPNDSFCVKRKHTCTQKQTKNIIIFDVCLHLHVRYIRRTYFRKPRFCIARLRMDLTLLLLFHQQWLFHDVKEDTCITNTAVYKINVLHDASIAYSFCDF